MTFNQPHGLSNNGFPNSGITEQEVRTRFDEFLEALKVSDLTALEQIYADDYTLIRPDGQKLSKKTILDDIKNHSMKFTRFETSDIDIKASGSVGILSVETKNAFLRDGKEGKTHVRQVVVFIKRDSKIMITHFQATNIIGESRSND